MNIPLTEKEFLINYLYPSKFNNTPIQKIDPEDSQEKCIYKFIIILIRYLKAGHCRQFLLYYSTFY